MVGGGADAENRLVSVTIVATGHRSEFGYDGLGRRVVIKELDPDANQVLQVTSDKKYLWDGAEIAEERDATGGVVLKRFFEQGFIDSDGTKLFYTRDHLGSIRELIDNSQTVRARYDYDPYGRMTKVSGDRDTVFGYTGYFWHAQSRLSMAVFRAYDPNLGRWINRDPISEFGGLNVYSYVKNNPINEKDLLGLCQEKEYEVTQCFLRFSEELNIAYKRAIEDIQIALDTYWGDMMDAYGMYATASAACLAAAAKLVAPPAAGIALTICLGAASTKLLSDYRRAKNALDAKVLSARRSIEDAIRRYNENIKTCKLCDCPTKDKK